jgi:glucokinase
VAYLALGVVNLVNLLNPSAVVLVGGRLTADAAAVRWLVQAVRTAALPRAVASLTHVGVSQNGAEAGLLGAAALAYEGMESTGGAIVHG